MKVVAITACHTGIAHCYMAADRLVEAARTLNIQIKVETQGAMGIENKISEREFDSADHILLATEITPSESDRYAGKTLTITSVQEAINHPIALLKKFK
ncbi:PTS fructose transporter subunit IIB [Grimontia sp. AD028]|uniref:protein-N(pi)-phosphohistidine--D-fructose phosphotransferase n=3 Tax=Grimontia TaxID=246861 RepID=A0A128FII5_9GAMM|nr:MULTISPECIES: fructose PTS transporter subunit IIB [Grimontia]EOD79771.1 PTS system, fructose-specific IIB component [Grimontia indica]KKD60402.1 PTS fructose transporter subunit IIB [Grimontia sp. AD028]CZF79764.1 PTS system mannose-specific EIIBCA component [Grimontia celer]CZF86081.1 PTS system mannose-specific EIIBCA component [Grimontia marina]